MSVYDTVQNQTRRERAQGPLYSLKKYHNSVKRDVLCTYTCAGDTLLDLGCGRGGDLQKWAHLSHVHGIDISCRSIEEAQRRCSNPQIRFTCADVRTHQIEGRYDAVSTMFCLHYFFESEPILRHVVSGISRALRFRKYWCGCCLNSTKVQEWIASQRISDHLRIEPGQTFSKPGPCGREYTYSLDNTVTQGTSIEYLIDFDFLKDIALEYGLYCVECQTFEPQTYKGHEATAMCLRFAFVQTKDA